jgi:hypothetical protein
MSYLPLSLVRAFAPRFRLGLSVAPPFGLECLTSFPDVRSTMPSADFCLPGRSPEVSSAAFGAQPPGVRSAFLMDMDFAVGSRLVPRSRLYPVLVHRLALLLHASFRPPSLGSPCASLSFTSIRLDGRLSLPSCFTCSAHSPRVGPAGPTLPSLSGGRGGVRPIDWRPSLIN